VAEAEQIKTPEATIYETLRELLQARGASGVEVRHESRLGRDLGLDSLELAELSAVLEDELGSDPYSDGLVPETVSDLVAYYDG
jgi:acyl carrier protein